MQFSFMLTQAKEQYDQLLAARISLKQGHIETAKKELVEILDESTQTFEEHRLLYAINQKLRELSLQIQAKSQENGIRSGKVDVPKHIDDTLRINRLRLGEGMRYENRLSLLLSPSDRYAKINKKYLDNEKYSP